MRKWLLIGTLMGLLIVPAPALAEPTQIRVAGAYGRNASGLHGELVQVFVPWGGINARGDILQCMTGQYQVTDNVLTIQKPDRLVKIRLKGGSEADWELLEASGICAGLAGSGSYRITSTPMIRLDGSLDIVAPASQS